MKRKKPRENASKQMIEKANGWTMESNQSIYFKMSEWVKEWKKERGIAKENKKKWVNELPSERTAQKRKSVVLLNIFVETLMNWPFLQNASFVNKSIHLK